MTVTEPLPGGMVPGDVRDRIKDLKRKVNECYFELGRLLHEVETKRLWREWGFRTYTEYIEREVGIRKSKANYLIRIHTELRVKCSVGDMLIDVEWTKARAISRVATPESVGKWVEKAQAMTRDELEAEVRYFERKSLPPPRPTGPAARLPRPQPRSIPVEDSAPELHRFTCGLTEEQDEDVRNAIQKAQLVAGPERSKGHVLQLIALEFLAGYLEQTKSRAWARWVLARLERQFGLNVLALDSKTGEVVYGEGRKRPEGDSL